MSSNSSAINYQLHSQPANGARLAVYIVLTLWFILIFWLGSSGFFISPPPNPPLHLLLALLCPIALFLIGFSSSRLLRHLALTADMGLLTGTQSWRFGGFVFLALYAQGLLPGYFAWPAALGDMFIGVTAPWLVIALLRQPPRIKSGWFITWNIFGILDLVVAVSMGAVAPRLVPSLAKTVTTRMVTTAPMVHLPLVLIPAFLVPLFICLHIVALLQARNSRTDQQ